MTDTYTPSLRLQLPTIGADGNNVWPTVLNTDWGLVDNAVTGVAGIDLTGLTTYTLTANDGQPDQARSLLQSYVGTPTGDCTVTLPASVKIGWAQNATSGGHDVILTIGSGATLTLTQGGWNFFYCDGASVIAPVVAFGGIAGTIVSDSGIQSTGHDTGAFNFRMVGATYGSGFRNDDSDTYLMLTDSGDPFGVFNSLRPFAVSNSTGAVTIDATGVGAAVGADATSGKQIMTFDQTFGAGAAVIDKSGSRALGASYTNSTGKPIFVVASASSSAGALMGITIGSGPTVFGSSSVTPDVTMTACAVVPAGATYLANVTAGTGTLSGWTEFTV